MQHYSHGKSTNQTTNMSSSGLMRAIGVSEYGPPENLHSKEVPKPGKPTGRQLLVQVKGGKSP